MATIEAPERPELRAASNAQIEDAALVRHKVIDPRAQLLVDQTWPHRLANPFHRL